MVQTILDIYKRNRGCESNQHWILKSVVANYLLKNGYQVEFERSIYLKTSVHPYRHELLFNKLFWISVKSLSMNLRKQLFTESWTRENSGLVIDLGGNIPIFWKGPIVDIHAIKNDERLYIECITSITKNASTGSHAVPLAKLGRRVVYVLPYQMHTHKIIPMFKRYAYAVWYVNLNTHELFLN